MLDRRGGLRGEGVSLPPTPAALGRSGHHFLGEMRWGEPGRDPLPPSPSSRGAEQSGCASRARAPRARARPGARVLLV